MFRCPWRLPCVGHISTSEQFIPSNGQHSCRATGQHEQADELLERCLYALEMALHPYCVLGDASCRIPYESEKNRPLFTALFKHMQVCSQLANTRWLH